MENESRLPAGSTLEVAPGLHVPHPHAEVNLPGRPDNRFVGSDAVTETLVPQIKDESFETTAPMGEQKPLAPEVIPNTLTTTGTNTVEVVKVGEGETLSEEPQKPAPTDEEPKQ